MKPVDEAAYNSFQDEQAGVTRPRPQSTSSQAHSEAASPTIAATSYFGSPLNSPVVADKSGFIAGSSQASRRPSEGEGVTLSALHSDPPNHVPKVEGVAVPDVLDSPPEAPVISDKTESGWSAVSEIIGQVDEAKIKGYKEDIDNILVFVSVSMCRAATC